MTTGSHYTVLARRFRPQAFGDVVGQEHVAQALRNAIRSGRVAHAYLFTGARGVGKTSTARILAKALNCPHAEDGVPCNQCDICQGISSGQDVDVLEIDGASNRGIDDIRSLRANVGVRSMRTQYKVYIIDEVHMLTKEAFNALLKTLEEPPPNVKFVFCTTEPNKVPDTILSRCQRFDFSAIDEKSIAQRLEEIARAEGFEVSPDALELVARRARGSMRDSQSLFDQLLAFSTGVVEADDVHRMLGTADDERLVRLMSAAVEHRPGEVLTVLEEAVDAGVQISELAEQLIGYVRDLMVSQVGGDTVALCSVSNRYRETLKSQGKLLGMHSVMAAFQILSEARTQMFRSTFARTILEMAMVQIAVLENLSSISELLSGRLPALPDLPPGEAQKKNNELTVPSSTPDPAEPPSRQNPHSETATSPNLSQQPIVAVAPAAVAQAAAAPEAVEVAPISSVSDDEAAALLKRLTGKLGMTAAAAISKSVEFRLIAPNRFELQLDGSAEMARRFAEQADQRTNLETELSRIVGQSVTIAVKLVAVARSAQKEESLTATSTSAAETSTAKHQNSPGTSTLKSSGPAEKDSQKKTESRHSAAPVVPAVNLINDVDPSKDPFVKHVIDTFGATVVRVMPAPEVKGAAVDDGNSAA